MHRFGRRITPKREDQNRPNTSASSHCDRSSMNYISLLGSRPESPGFFSVSISLVIDERFSRV